MLLFLWLSQTDTASQEKERKLVLLFLFLLLWPLMLLLSCFKPFCMNFFKSSFEGGDPKSCVCVFSNHHKGPKQVHLHPSFFVSGL